MKRVVNISINEEVLRAVDERSALVGMNRSQFFDLVMGTACEVYKASAVLPSMLQSYTDAQESGQVEADPLTA